MKEAPQIPYGYTIFCDDIREEVGNKHSYMGLYRGVLRLATPFPATLAKLVVIVNWQEPADKEYVPVTVRIFLPGQEDDGEPAVNLTVPADAVNGAMTNLPDVPLSEHLRSFMIPATFSPMQFAAAGKIRVTATRGDQVYKLGSLIIQAPADASSASASEASSS